MKWLLLTVVTCLSYTGSAGLDLVVLHTNDMHSHFEEVSRTSGACNPKYPCFGGFARIKAEADRIRRTEKNVIFLNAGDNFQGTPYYTFFKWQVVAEFIDLLGINVMSLGNHEFDDGPDGLVPYLKTVQTPSVTCNIDTSKEDFSGTNLYPWYSLNVDNVQVAIVGYLTPQTKFLARTGNVVLKDEVTSIRETAEAARRAGAKLVIAVGHSGFDVDIRIAKEVELVDVVVGGHTNTFLYTGSAPDLEKPVSEYPYIVTQTSGKRVPVVQAFAFTKYLGYLTLKFDDNFQLVSYGGNPILLNSSYPKDETVENKLSAWRSRFQMVTENVTGYSRVVLDGFCRFNECNLGNFITDAFVDYVVQYRNFTSGNADSWTVAPVAILNGGSIRTGMDTGDITYGELMTVLPFDNPVYLLKLNGSVLLEVLEQSVRNYDITGVVRYGGFLQFSGIKVQYNISKEPEHRVESVLVRCGNCSIPEYRPLVLNETYTIIASSFISEGGDNYTALATKAEKILTLEDSDLEIFRWYVNKSGIVYPEVGGRIILHKPPMKEFSASGANRIAANNLFAMIFIVAMFSLMMSFA